jgi:hypothetical protein
MKTNMARKVHKLDPDDDLDYLVSAIICGSRDFRLCFELNYHLGLAFLRCDDVELYSGRPGSTTYHSYYKCSGGNSEVFHILSNRDRNRTGYFIPEMKEADFFFLVTSYTARYNFGGHLAKIKEIDLVAGVYALDRGKMKSADSFRIFLEE